MGGIEMEVKLISRWVTGRAVEPSRSRIPTLAGPRVGCPGRKLVGSHATSE
jgi:hypothetical protein